MGFNPAGAVWDPSSIFSNCMTLKFIYSPQDSLVVPTLGQLPCGVFGIKL